MTTTTLDLLTESGLNIDTEDGHHFLIISRYVTVDVSTGGSWGQNPPAWVPLDQKFSIKVMVSINGKTWVQEKEITPMNNKNLYLVKVAFHRLNRLMKMIKVILKIK